MSRVAKNPITIPSSVEFNVDNRGEITAKGPKGTLSMPLHGTVAMERNHNLLTFSAKEGTKFAKAMSGTTRSLVNNLIEGVLNGFEKKLELRGVGYKAAVQGKKVVLNLGYSHTIEHLVPEGVTITAPSATELVIASCDKQKVGEEAAKIRAYRKPEPYKGKGVRYHDEVVRMKETKK